MIYFSFVYSIISSCDSLYKGTINLCCNTITNTIIKQYTIISEERENSPCRAPCTPSESNDEKNLKPHENFHNNRQHTRT